MEKLNIEELLKDYIETLDNMLEQDEDIKVNLVDELVEKFKDYGKED